MTKVAAGLLDSIKKLWNRNYKNTAYGEEVARRAREHGVVPVEPWYNKKNVSEYIPPGKARKLVAWLLRNSMLGDKFWSDPKNTLANKDKVFFSHQGVISQDPVKAYKEIVGKAPSKDLKKLLKTRNYPKIISAIKKKDMNLVRAAGEDKELEAKYIKDIGRTENLQTLLRKVDRSKLVEVLRKMYGRKGFVLKKRNEAGTIATRGTKNPSIYFSKDDNIGDIAKINLKDAKKWIVQPDKDLRKSWRILKTPDWSGVDEYRVHVMNGKVVPYASRHRGNFLRTYLEPLLPFMPSSVNKVEDYAAKVLKRIKHKGLRKGNYAFDIAFDNKGKPRLIETNPLDNKATGTSGLYIGNPTVMDAYQANIKGTLPKFELMKRLGYGTAALGTGAEMYNLAKSNNELNK